MKQIKFKLKNYATEWSNPTDDVEKTLQEYKNNKRFWDFVESYEVHDAI